MTPEDAAPFMMERERIAAVTGSGGDRPYYQGEFELTRKEGSGVWTEITLTRLPDTAGRTDAILGVIRNIAERKRAEVMLWRQANHDKLTGLPNRQLFLERLQQCLGRAEQEEHQVALLFIDLDRFKEVNDTRGHAAGDQ